jgi:hypothetical protein
LIDQSQLEECLEIQSRMKELRFDLSIGQILVSKFYLDQPSVRALVRAQGDAREEKVLTGTRFEIVKFTPAEHDTLVRRVREGKLVSADQIDECFHIQCELERVGIDTDLGEILIQKGYLGIDLVRDLLFGHEETKQKLNREIIKAPAKVSRSKRKKTSTGLSTVELPVIDPLRRFDLPENPSVLFGSIALEKGLLEEIQVKEGLFIQFKLKELGVVKRVGEVLVEKRYLKPPDVLRILNLQKKLMGKVKWVDKNSTVSKSSEDVNLANLLQGNEILGQDEISECMYVQKVMKGLGLTKSLAEVLVDKEYLDDEIVQAILREQRRLESAKSHVTSEPDFDVLRSELRETYKEILARKRPTGEVHRNRHEPIRSVRPKGRAAWYLFASVFGLGLVGCVVAMTFYFQLEEREPPSVTSEASVKIDGKEGEPADEETKAQIPRRKPLPLGLGKPRHLPVKDLQSISRNRLKLLKDQWPLSPKLREKYETNESSLVVEAISAQIPGKNTAAIYVWVQGLSRVSEGSRVRISLLNADGKSVREEVVRVKENGGYSLFLGPFRSELSPREDGRFTHRFLQAGVYSVLARNEIGEVSRKAGGSPEGVEARCEFHHPPKGMEFQQSRERDQGTSVLSQLGKHFRKCDQKLDSIIRSLSKKPTDLEKYTNEIERWSKKIDQGIRPYRRYRDSFVGPVNDRRFRLVDRYVIILEELRAGMTSSSSPLDAVRENRRTRKRAANLLASIENRIEND